MVSYEVLVEQDNTLYEKKFRFEYVHQEKEIYTEEELEFFTSREKGIELFLMRHPGLVGSVDGEIIEFNGVDFEMHKKYMALKNKNAVRERIFIGQQKTTELILYLAAAKNHLTNSELVNLSEQLYTNMTH